jgi:GT2 family glycosyltransferase
MDSSMTINPLRIAVGIASLGRREVLSKTIDILAQQTRLPDLLIVCAGGPEDVDAASLDSFPAPTRLITGTAVGLCAKRNKIIAAATTADIIVFFDDDFFADAAYLANLEAIFLMNPDVVAATGFVLADGIKGPGLSIEQAVGINHAGSSVADGVTGLIDIYGAYGCNMAFRLGTVRDNDLWFDENLPLYGWQEDTDFSVRLGSYGRVVKSHAIRGVHLGVKAGRTSGIRVGYSQIANPLYLVRKGSMAWSYAANLMWRNVAANLARSLYPEPWVDRKGRLTGNLRALADIVLGRLSPLRIMQFR